MPSLSVPSARGKSALSSHFKKFAIQRPFGQFFVGKKKILENLLIFIYQAKIVRFFAAQTKNT